MIDITSTLSPLPSKPIVQPGNIDFQAAIKAVTGGNKIHRLEWQNKEFYGIVSEGRLRLHKPDGKLYDWIISEGDLVGTDWIVI